MTNPFHELERMIQSETMDREELCRALMLAVYLESCEDCGSKLRSEEFRESFQKLLDHLKICHDLSGHQAA